jgi:hypothetical protein
VDGAALVIPHGLALPGLEASLAADALDFHTGLEAAAASHDRPWNKVHTFLGSEQKTRLWASKTDGVLEYHENAAPGASAFLNSGDGTVPQISAIPIPGTVMRETAIAEMHGSLHVNSRNLEALRQRIDALQFGITAVIPEAATINDLTVRWDEWFAEGNLVTAYVGTGNDFPTDVRITVTTDDVEGFVPVVVDVAAAADGSEIVLGEFAPGRYRALVQSGIASDVHALFGVA